MDLRQVTLIDLDLSRCHLGTVRCGGATFSGDARFDEATFSRNAWFGKVTFLGNAWFGNATFEEASFGYATFLGYAWFDEATFSGHASFHGARFVMHAGRDALGPADFATGEPFWGAVFGPEQPDDDGDEGVLPS